MHEKFGKIWTRVFLEMRTDRHRHTLLTATGGKVMAQFLLLYIIHLADLCVCWLRLRTVDVSQALQSPGLSCKCPGLERLLTSATFCCVWPQNLEPTTYVSSITRSNSLFIQAPAQNPPVPALDYSAGCSCGCRVPSSGAVVTVRRLQMTRLKLNSTQSIVLLWHV